MVAVGCSSGRTEQNEPRTSHLLEGVHQSCVVCYDWACRILSWRHESGEFAHVIFVHSSNQTSQFLHRIIENLELWATRQSFKHYFGEKTKFWITD
jgi:hypothetical protein